MKPGATGRTDQAWITTADGLRVEILEDKAQTVPIKHHHVHYYLAEAAIPEIQAWYVKHFGAEAGMRGQFQAADIPGADLTFTKSDTPTVPTLGPRARSHRLRREGHGSVLKRLEARHQARPPGRDAARRHSAHVHPRSVGHLDRAQRAGQPAVRPARSPNRAVGCCRHGTEFRELRLFPDAYIGRRP